MTGRPGVCTYLVRTSPVPEVPLRTAVSQYPLFFLENGSPDSIKYTRVNYTV